MIHATGLKLKMVTLSQEPGEHCVGDAAGDHRKDAEFEEDAETQAGDDRLNAEEVAPPVWPLVWIAPPEASIESQREDNGHDGHADHDGDQRQSNDLRSGPVLGALGKVSTDRWDVTAGFETDDDLSASVAFFQIPDRLGDVIQSIPPVDHR